MQVRKLLNGRTLFALVNNAGAAFHGPLMYQPIEDFRKNIEINLIGTLQVTQVSTENNGLPENINASMLGQITQTICIMLQQQCVPHFRI